MSNEKKHFSFILFFGGVFTSFLVACGGDSGSNASSDDVNSSTSTIRSGTSTTPTSQENLNFSGKTYRTYEVLRYDHSQFEPKREHMRGLLPKSLVICR